jgi:hypothetical protein
MKHVLALYYSQSGQLQSILESVVMPLQAAEDVQVTLQEIAPGTPYPYPWSAMSFLDALPESVAGAPCPMQAVRYDLHQPYDLIILAYQVWYLAPSIPIASFLSSDAAKTLFSGKQVVTVIGCRNMWLTAHDRMRSILQNLRAQLVANIVLTDKAPNLVSMVATVVWMLTGNKGPRWGLPAAGVAREDIGRAHGYGEHILAYLRGQMPHLQDALVAQGAVPYEPQLHMQEKTAARAFRKWATFIRASGGPGDPHRAPRLRLLQVCFPLVILLMAPLYYLIHFATLPFRRRRIQAARAHYLRP